MKKLATLLLAAGMVVAASAPASAIDVKVSGQYTFDFQAGSTYTDEDTTANNYSGTRQRLRVGLDFVASENLSGFFQVQNDNSWGDAASNNGDKTLQARLAYIDWTVPGTAVKVRMGRQELGLPGDAFGQNMVMHSSFGSRDAITVAAPVTDWLSATAFWLRGYASSAGKADPVAEATNDAFGAVAKIKGNGFTVEPWAMYADIDDASKGNMSWGGGKNLALAGAGQAYWLGATATLTAFDPFKLVASFAWSELNYEKSDLERQGWYATAKASYKTAFGTPILAGWYATGDDKNDTYEGQSWLTQFGGRCRPMTVIAGAEAGLVSDPNNTNHLAGTWGAQVGIEGVSFLKDLSHDFKVTYIAGTNEKDKAGTWSYMTDEDSAVEIDFRSVYKIYKNLSATLDFSYIINDFDNRTDRVVEEDAWRTAVTFIYKF